MIIDQSSEDTLVRALVTCIIYNAYIHGNDVTYESYLFIFNIFYLICTLALSTTKNSYSPQPFFAQQKKKVKEI